MSVTEEVSPREMLEYIKAELEEFANDVNKIVQRRIEIIDRYIGYIDGGEEALKPLESEKPVSKSSRKKYKLEGPITPNQLKYLKALYERMDRVPPPDIEKWSKATASAMIDELLKKVGKK